MKSYAGIGSRKTPTEICGLFTRIAERFAALGWTLRSGGSPGADGAFESGAGAKEIFLPWEGFNDSPSPLFGPGLDLEGAEKIAAEARSGWRRLSKAGKKMHRRNVFQVLGHDLQSPVSLVVCWTERGEPIGGTRTAILLADERDIPVYNFGDPTVVVRFEEVGFDMFVEACER
jgi:hypothetical protein